MNWKQVCALARKLPEVTEGTWYGTPGLNVHGKFFARLKEDGEAVMFRLESVEEQEFLIGTRPTIYFITDHYRGYAAVLARLSALRPAECRERLEHGWRLKAPRRLLAASCATPTAPSRAKPRAKPRAKRA